MNGSGAESNVPLNVGMKYVMGMINEQAYLPRLDCKRSRLPLKLEK